MVWLTSGALVIALAMIVGLLALVFYLGSTSFVVRPLVQVELVDGSKQLGEVFRSEQFPLTTDLVFREPAEVRRQIVTRLLGANIHQSWSALPAEVSARANELRTEAADAAVRLAEVRRKLERLQAVRPPAPESPTARVEWIRDDRQAEALAAVRQQIDTLAAREESLKQQAVTTEQASETIGKAAAGADPLATIIALPEDVQMAVVDALMARQARQLGQTHLPERRRLLRTGNFDITGAHFHWVADYQIKPTDESTPPWGVVIERFKDGLFIGFPQSLIVRHRRPIESREKQLDQQITLLEQSASLLKEPSQKETLEKALDVLRADRVKLRRAEVAAFIQGFQTASPGTFLAVTASGAKSPLTPWKPGATAADDPISEIIETFDGPVAAWRQFEARHGEILARREERVAIESAAGRLDQGIEDARLRCQEAEIREWDALRGGSPSGVLQGASRFPTLKMAERLAAWNHELAEMKDQAEEANQTASRLGQQYGAESPPAKATARIAALLRASAQDRETQLPDEVAIAKKQLAAEPKYVQDAIRDYLEAVQSAAKETATVQKRIEQLKAENDRYQLQMATAQQVVRLLPLDDIVRATPSNRLTGWQSARVYFSRWWEFLTAEPRNGNSEGGVFPAIFGTVVMTLLMSLAVVPFGVLAALYLREYAKAGPIVSLIRISINNLAGVPSIVFGVFGLGFFCYVVGAYIDGGPGKAQFSALPKGLWLTLTAATAVVCVLAFTAGLFGLAARKAEATRWQRISRLGGGALWIAATLLIVYLLATTPFFHGFYRAYAPNPKFGTGGLLWASLTLALLTLPVVIVATEEALSAVPNSMREGSYGCGASRWQTIRRVVLPQALPGIMTGMILAMARGAGEVAPLMLVGAVHSANALPIDTTIPFVHAERSFMHLGYHIYYLGFQSQNSQAAMPMVFTTTLLLIAIVATLNIAAMWLRAKLRRRFQQGQF